METQIYDKMTCSAIVPKGRSQWMRSDWTYVPYTIQWKSACKLHLVKILEIFTLQKKLLKNPSTESKGLNHFGGRRKVGVPQEDKYGS